jgi:hypothetical protein
MAQLDTIVATLRADTAQFESGMQRAGRQVDGLRTSSVGAEHGLRVLRSGVVSLALSTTGVDSGIGRIAQALLLLGAGSTAVLGVAAGVAVIAKAYDVMTARAREAAKAQDDLRAAIAKMAEAARDPAEKLREQLMKGQAEIARLNKEITEREQAIAAREAVGLTGGVARLRDELIKLRSQRNALILQIRQLLGGAVTLEAVTVDVPPRPGGMRPPGDLIRSRDFQGGAPGLPPLRGRDIRFYPTLPEMKTGLDTLQNELEPVVQQMGQLLGHVFAQAMMGGITDLKDIFKSILASFLEAGINFAISKSIGGIFHPSGAGGVAASVQGGGQFSVVAPPLPQMIHPYDAARMAEWQQLYRETALVANSQGFRAA